jgi:hypothetical protein
MGGKKQTVEKMFEAFIESYQYGEMKRVENQLKASKTFVKEQLRHQEEKRIAFDDLAMVARYTPKFIYEWDEEGLIEFLTDYLSVPLLVSEGVLSIEPKKLKEEDPTLSLLEDFKKEGKSSLRPAFNKRGKLFVNGRKEMIITSFQSVQRAVSNIKRRQQSLENLTSQYEELKSTILQCPVMQSERRIEHAYGSLSLTKAKDSYQQHAILDVHGEAFMIRYGKINKTAMQELAKRKFISLNDVHSFRKVTDVRLDFTVMSMEAEQRMFDGMKQKERRLMEQAVR